MVSNLVKTKVTYLGPLAAIAHTAPSGITRNFLRNIPFEDDYSQEDLLKYAEAGGFQVDRVVIKFRKVVPVTEEVEAEMIIGV